MMLADRVEAACRTLPEKGDEDIRAMIQKLVNGAIMDGQLNVSFDHYRSCTPLWTPSRIRYWAFTIIESNTQGCRLESGWGLIPQ